MRIAGFIGVLGLIIGGIVLLTPARFYQPPSVPANTRTAGVEASAVSKPTSIPQQLCNNVQQAISRVRHESPSEFANVFENYQIVDCTIAHSDGPPEAWEQCTVEVNPARQATRSDIATSIRSITADLSSCLGAPDRSAGVGDPLPNKAKTHEKGDTIRVGIWKVQSQTLPNHPAHVQLSSEIFGIDDSTDDATGAWGHLRIAAP